MKKLFFAIIFLLAISFFGCSDVQKNDLPPFPSIPPRPVVETYFDTTITDHFRNLEDLNDSTTLQWYKEQSDYGAAVLKRISGRKSLLDTFKAYDARKDFVISDIVVTENENYFYLKRNKDEEVAGLYYRATFDSEEELLFIPSDFRKDQHKDHVISAILPNWDGSVVAITLTGDGSEISEMIFFDMAKRHLLPDMIGNVDFLSSWTPDNKSIIYMYAPVTDPSSELFSKNGKSTLHTLGDPANPRKFLFSKDTHPELNIFPEEYTWLSVEHSKVGYLYGAVYNATAYYDGYYADIQDLNKEKVNWKSLFRKEDKVWGGYFFGDQFYMISYANASNGQILSKQISKAGIGDFEIVVKEKEDEVLDNLVVTSKGLFYTTTKNGIEARLYRYENGSETEIVIPKSAGTITLSNIGANSSKVWVTTSGWINDYTRYGYDYDQNRLVQEDLELASDYPEFEHFLVEEIEIPSHDGTALPLSVIHKQELKKNSGNPLFIFGYGSYGDSFTPFFDPIFLSWVENGGILVCAHVRGGGEKGDVWYESGKKENKSNTWKDFIAATEYFIANEYTTPQKIVAWSASAGGILVGRAMTTRPDLYKAIIAEVPAMNALRQEHAPAGPTNTREFGSSLDSLDYKALIAMDPYLHLKKDVHYPASLLTVGMNDPRVAPWEAGKFVAKLQDYSVSDHPVLFKVDFNSGHGIDDKRQKVLEDWADIFSFAYWQTGHPEFIYEQE
ncbi:MAG: prolyl oligopeptidase family serine peptidase [Bacteroidota bacterium]